MRIIKTSELFEMGIVFNSFNVSSPAPVHYREKIDGRNGFVDMGTTYDGRVIDARITILPVDRQDYALLRNEVFSLFDSREPFYLQHDEKGKRWLVKYNSPFSFNRSGSVGQTPIQFISSNSFSESIGTTLDEKTFEVDLWQFGQGLDLDETDYIQTTNTFAIYNAGEKIDPRELPLKIYFKGASDGLTITNNTNGTEWMYNATSSANDEILLDGIYSYKNGQSIFRDTNYKSIELEKDWNEFSVSGASNFEIKFEFRFYSL